MQQKEYNKYVVITGKHGRLDLKPECIKRFCVLYKSMTKEELACRYDVSIATIHRWAAELNLHKSKQMLRKFKRQAAIMSVLSYRARKLKRVVPNNRIYDIDENYVIKHYADTPTADIAKHFKCSEWAIIKVARKHKLYKNTRYSGRDNRRFFSESDRQYILDNYASHSTAEIAAHINRSESSVRRIAHRNGISKNKEYLRKSARINTLACMRKAAETNTNN